MKFLKWGKGYVIHHLRETAEQRDFNDNYYERWGINFNGIMQYCVLMTREDHSKHHAESLETRNKIGASSRKKWKENPNMLEGAKKLSLIRKGMVFSEETRRKIKENNKASTLEARRKMSEKKKDVKWWTDGQVETLCRICPEGFYKGRVFESKIGDLYRGKHRSTETRQKMSKSKKGKPSTRSRPIRCVETGEIFPSSMATGLRHARDCAGGRRQIAGGFHWEWVDSVKKDIVTVTNDTSSGSTKNKKAADLGVEVITEKEFLELIR